MDRPLVIQGREVRPEDVALIQAWLQTHPGSNRTRLSRELCAAWNWRNAAGRLKDMAARSLLLKLEAQGHIELPPRRTASVNGLRNGQSLRIDLDESPILCPLKLLLPLRVELVVAGSSQALLWRGLLQRYHYLGQRNCVGENLQYLVEDRHGRALACLLFGSAAWKSAGRERWIGWTEQQRRRNLGLLTNNTRLLILPWVRVPHLASHLLGRVLARLSTDWQQKYGHPRFAGICYRAAGWVRVGLTTGRTRNDNGLKPRVAPKALYLKALRADARRRLWA